MISKFLSVTFFEAWNGCRLHSKANTEEVGAVSLFKVFHGNVTQYRTEWNARVECPLQHNVTCVYRLSIVNKVLL